MPKATCSIEGCSNTTASRGWCSKHYQRWRDHGDPHYTSTKNAGRVLTRQADGPCSVAGCDHPAFARGWCNSHYARWHSAGEPGTDIIGREPPNLLRYGSTVLERFWANVAPAVGGGCSEWTGRSNEAGYGVFRIGRGKKVLAHRFSLEVSTAEPIPAGLFVCHHCDNPPCTRTEHLFVGNNLDNSWDMARKGRAPHLKLTPGDVLAIRSSATSRVLLASQYGVSRGQIDKILQGNAWRHLLPAEETG